MDKKAQYLHAHTHTHKAFHLPRCAWGKSKRCCSNSSDINTRNLMDTNFNNGQIIFKLPFFFVYLGSNHYLTLFGYTS